MISEQQLSLDQIEAGESYEKCHLTYSDERLSFEGVTLKNCTFDQSDFSHSEWDNCVFEGCEFLNNNFTESFFYQTKFSKCRLMGADFSGSTLLKSTIVDSKADYLNLSATKLEECSFLDSSLQEAYFQEVKIKKGLNFQRCDLDGTDFLGTSLKGVDLSSSLFESLNVEPRLLKGCQISITQAAVFVGLLGIKFKE